MHFVVPPTFIVFFQREDIAEAILVSKPALATPNFSISALLPDLVHQSRELLGALEPVPSRPIQEMAGILPPRASKHSPVEPILPLVPRID